MSLPSSRSFRMRPRCPGRSGQGSCHWSVPMPPSHSAASRTSPTTVSKSPDAAGYRKNGYLPTLYISPVSGTHGSSESALGSPLDHNHTVSVERQNSVGLAKRRSAGASGDARTLAFPDPGRVKSLPGESSRSIPVSLLFPCLASIHIRHHNSLTPLWAPISR